MPKNKGILIVDDSILIVERLLEMLGHVENIGTIKHAGTYEQANVLFEQFQPHIVLLDINLPDRSGIDLLNKIKTNYQEIVVIMFTNHAGSYYRNMCMKLGASYFIDKSTDFDLIPGIISTINKESKNLV